MLVIRGVIGECADELPWGLRADGLNAFQGGGWRFEVGLDKTYRLLETAGLVVIHDGRIGACMGDPLALNGSWLVLQPRLDGGLNFVSDRIGTVPIYWGHKDGRAYFSTRLVDLVDVGFRDPDPIGCYQYVLQNQPNWERTVLEGVSLIPPAGRFVLKSDSVTNGGRYWQPTVNDSPEENGERWREEGAEIIRRANDCAIRSAVEGPVAWPLTGGLDSRCNTGCCESYVKDSDRFFHVEDMGEYELPIARQLARVFGHTVQVFHSDDWMRKTPAFDIGMDSGDFNVGHWRLAGAAQELARTSGCVSTVDGFLQGILMNPAMFFHEGTVESTRDRRFGTPMFRAKLFEMNTETPTFRAFREDYMERFPGGRHALDASQQYIMENRSRRMVFGIVRLNGNFLDVRTPGLDIDFIDYAMRLPWGLRKGARVYKEIIGLINPRLAAIKHDKTGLPVSAGPAVARSRKVMKFVRYYVNRVWPGGGLIIEKQTGFERLLRTEPVFRQQVYDAIGGSRWVREVFGNDMVGVLERQRTGRGYSFDGIGAMLTMALLERGSGD